MLHLCSCQCSAGAEGHAGLAAFGLSYADTPTEGCEALNPKNFCAARAAG